MLHLSILSIGSNKPDEHASFDKFDIMRLLAFLLAARG